MAKTKVGKFLNKAGKVAKKVAVPALAVGAGVAATALIPGAGAKVGGLVKKAASSNRQGFQKPCRKGDS